MEHCMPHDEHRDDGEAPRQGHELTGGRDTRDAVGLLNSYWTNQLSPEQEHVLLQSAVADQEVFDLLMEAEAIRDALSSAEQHHRVVTALRLWNAVNQNADIKRMLP